VRIDCVPAGTYVVLATPPPLLKNSICAWAVTLPVLSRPRSLRH
jgi:hypothetical protein